jgi:hypothetical protein
MVPASFLRGLIASICRYPRRSDSKSGLGITRDNAANAGLGQSWPSRAVLSAKVWEKVVMPACGVEVELPQVKFHELNAMGPSSGSPNASIGLKSIAFNANGIRVFPAVVTLRSLSGVPFVT